MTTNPSLVAKEGVKFEDRIAEILQAVPKVESVSAEVTPNDIQLRSGEKYIKSKKTIRTNLTQIRIKAYLSRMLGN